MRVSPAHAGVAANIAPTAKQIILLTLILIPFRLALNVSSVEEIVDPHRALKDFLHERAPPNLMCDVEQRDHHHKSAGDLSDVGEIAQIHLSQSEVVGQGRPLPNQKTATDAVALQLPCALKLAFVLGSIEVAFRFCDESVVADLPEFIAANANTFPSAARARVRPG